MIIFNAVQFRDSGELAESNERTWRALVIRIAQSIYMTER